MSEEVKEWTAVPGARVDPEAQRILKQYRIGHVITCDNGDQFVAWTKFVWALMMEAWARGEKTEEQIAAVSKDYYDRFPQNIKDWDEVEARVTR